MNANLGTRLPALKCTWRFLPGASREGRDGRKESSNGALCGVHNRSWMQWLLLLLLRLLLLKLLCP